MRIQDLKSKLRLSGLLLKTVSYRVVATATTVAIAYYLGMSLQISSLLGLSELIVKPILYFLHELCWLPYLTSLKIQSNS